MSARPSTPLRKSRVLPTRVARTCWPCSAPDALVDDDHMSQKTSVMLQDGTYLVYPAETEINKPYVWFKRRQTHNREVHTLMG